MTNNVASALCYVLTIITGILFLVLDPYNKDATVRFNAFQAIFMGIGMFVASFVLSFVIGLLHLYALSFLVTLLSLAFLCLWLYMIVMTYQGKTIVLPVVGPLAQKQSKSGGV